MKTSTQPDRGSEISVGQLVKVAASGKSYEGVVVYIIPASVVPAHRITMLKEFYGATFPAGKAKGPNTRPRYIVLRRGRHGLELTNPRLCTMEKIRGHRIKKETFDIMIFCEINGFMVQRTKVPSVMKPVIADI
ncbi:MAG: hypothetical protein WC455_09405 [Dehalococcoidia bacterium]|jgi:hypothetical protein